MSDYIDRQAAIEALRRAEALTRAFGYHNVIETIREMPSADVEPVRHGRWIRVTQDGVVPQEYCCDVCGRLLRYDGVPALLSICYPYCHCGARMDGDL